MSSSTADSLLSSLVERLEILDQRICHQDKLQRIEFALHNTDKFSFRINHNAFNLSVVHCDDSRIFDVTDLHSPRLVERILYEFRADQRVRLRFKYSERGPEGEFRQAVDSFRESLVYQIHRLTGTKPHAEWGYSEKTGKLTIWFSKEDYENVQSLKRKP